MKNSIKTIIKRNQTELTEEYLLFNSGTIRYSGNLGEGRIKLLLKKNKMSVCLYSIFKEREFIQKLKIRFSNNKFDFVGVQTYCFYPLEEIIINGERLFVIQITGGYNSTGAFYPDIDMEYEIYTLKSNSPSRSIINQATLVKRNICKITVR